jgi:hypothetical protein
MLRERGPSCNVDEQAGTPVATGFTIFTLPCGTIEIPLEIIQM